MRLLRLRLAMTKQDLDNIKMTGLLIKLGFLVWPFGNLLNFDIGGIRFAALDLVVALIILSALPELIRKRAKIISSPLFLPIAAFLSMAALSLLVRLPEIGLSPRPILYLARLAAYFSFYFVFLVHSPKKYTDYLKLTVFLFVIFSLVQYFFFPDMRSIKYLGYDDHYFRLIGPLFDPNFTGAIISSMSLFLFAKGWIKPALFLLIPLGLTFSRASYVSFLFPMLAFAWLRKKYIVLLFPLLLAIIIFLAPKPFGEGVNLTRTFSIVSRIESSKQGINLFLQRPIFGWGYNTLVSGEVRIGIDNSFIFLLSTTGIFGLGSLLYFLKASLQNRSLALKLALTSLIIHSFFNN